LPPGYSPNVPKSPSTRRRHSLRSTAPERAFRTLVELLGLERQGRQRDIIERRKTLRDLHPSLYAAYMRTR